MNQESFQLSVFSCQYFFRAEKTDFRPLTSDLRPSRHPAQKTIKYARIKKNKR
ncbi:MAG: hypothetical protein WC946_11470 [Bacteroidales bacterium]